MGCGNGCGILGLSGAFEDGVPKLLMNLLGAAVKAAMNKALSTILDTRPKIHAGDCWKSSEVSETARRLRLLTTIGIFRLLAFQVCQQLRVLHDLGQNQMIHASPLRTLIALLEDLRQSSAWMKARFLVSAYITSHQEPYENLNTHWCDTGVSSPSTT